MEINAMEYIEDLSPKKKEYIEYHVSYTYSWIMP